MGDARGHRDQAASLKAEVYACKAWGGEATCLRWQPEPLPLPFLRAREGGACPMAAGGMRTVASKVSLKGGLRSFGSEWYSELSLFCQTPI